MIQVIRWVSECDSVNVGQPMPRAAALNLLRGMSATMRADYDLVSVETGRLVSWVIA